MKKIIILFVLFAFMPFGTAYALSSEISVSRDGKAVMSTAKVMQIAGNTLFTRLYWGDAFIRFTIKTNSNTKFLRGTGEQTTISEIKEGDLLDAFGELQSQSDTLTLVATSVKNSSVQKEQSTFSGTVTKIDLPLRQFTVNSKERGLITVNTATTTQFFKGTRTLDLEHLRVGDRVSKISGDYDLGTKTLTTPAVTIYLDMSIFKPRLFVGKLAENPSSADATSIKVTIDKTLYTVSINNKTSILRNNRNTTTLQRFVAGDPIRIFGSIREVDEPIIDAEVIRNTNL